MGHQQARDGRSQPIPPADHPSSRAVNRAVARRSRLVGRPAPCSRAAGGGGPRSAGRPSGGSRVSQMARASSAEPRRSAKARTLSTRTARSSATVTTSPSRTGWLGASTRWPLIRTWPPAASAAAAERVRTTRACQSHLSMRWRSRGSTSAMLSAEPREGLRRGGPSTPSPSGAPWRSPRVAPSAPQAWRTGNSDQVRDRGGPCPPPAP